MAKQTINIGTTPGDGTGDPLRTAFTKVNENFNELYDEALDPADFVAVTQKGASNGVATLDSDGLVPATQLPEPAVSSVNTKTGAVVLNKSDVGLANVDNTSDANKPISGAMAAALTLKLNAADLVIFTGTQNGLVPSPSEQAGNFLRDDGTWAEVTDLAALALKADLAGATFTGTIETPLLKVGSDTAASTSTEISVETLSGTPFKTILKNGPAGYRTAILDTANGCFEVIQPTRDECISVSSGSAFSSPMITGVLNRDEWYDAWYVGSYDGAMTLGCYGPQFPRGIEFHNDTEIWGDLNVIGADGNNGTIKQNGVPVAFAKGVLELTASATLSLAHSEQFLRCNSATPMSLTIPTNAAVAFRVGATIEINQAGAGAVSIVADSGVTLQHMSTKTPDTAGQFAVICLVKVAEDVWSLSGDLTVFEVQDGY
jgi:hypothetical protein